LRGSDTTEAISKSIEKKEIAALLSVARSHRIQHTFEFPLKFRFFRV